VIQSPLVLAALIAALTALAFWLDHKVAPLSKIGASLLVILFGAILSNAGVVPAQSAVYDVISGPITSLSIAWLLLAVNLSDLKLAGPRMLGAFGLAAAGTVVGALVGSLVLIGAFGDDTWKLAGTLTGTYTGGSVNFVAVGRGVGLSGPLFAGANAADALTTALWLGVTLTLPVWLRRFYPTPIPAGTEGARKAEHPFYEAVPLSTLNVAVLLATGFALIVAADAIARVVPGIPAVLWLTTLALLVGHLTPLRRAAGAMQLGNLGLHLFFAVIGIYSRIADIVAVGVEVFYFTLIVVVVHGLIVYGIGRLVRLDVGTLSVASQASIGGPSSALAVAVARDWPGLVLPGIVVGLLGYAVGNYLGFGVAWFVRSLIGG
jgi:uncharacterized membrane protein